jgi:hypothetical protein
VIIEAAEKAAAGIIDDAEAQARNYLQESRVRADQIADQRAQEMSTLADALIERAEAVKRQSDELLRALDQAKLQVEERFRGEQAAISTPGSDPRPSPPLVREAPPEAEEPLPEQAPVHHLKPVGQPSWEAELPPSSEPPPVVTQAPDLQPPDSAEPGGTKTGPPAPGARLAGTPPSDGARLLATQMAVAGSSRAEIEGRLRNEFGIHDAGPMLDAILGREG